MTEADLNTYKLQLQQVEAALTTDPDNEELTTLQEDLKQVINLTQDLLNSQLGQTAGEPPEDDSEEVPQLDKKKSPSPISAASSSGAKKSKSRWAAPDPILPVKPWQVGEQCQALYAVDNQFHAAIIEEITTDGEVSIRFKGYKGSYVTSLGLLKLPESGTTTVFQGKGNKRDLAAKQKEYLKEKKKKKLEKMKEMEEAREKEKNKWQNFSGKAFGKKGFVKKSIFKSPVNADGRVGVGTCGISGEKMTEFSTAAKYRKGQ